jgi:hypothetical protein
MHTPTVGLRLRYVILFVLIALFAGYQIGYWHSDKVAADFWKSQEQAKPVSILSAHLKQGFEFSVIHWTETLVSRA